MSDLPCQTHMFFSYIIRNQVRYKSQDVLIAKYASLLHDGVYAEHKHWVGSLLQTTSTRELLFEIQDHIHNVIRRS